MIIWKFGPPSILPGLKKDYEGLTYNTLGLWTVTNGRGSGVSKLTVT